jgi:hypothetical protein
MKHLARLLVALAVVVGLQRAAADPALAFKPNDGGHLGITSEAIRPISRTVSGETLKFSERALKQIRDANRATDIPFGFTSENHFDNELFAFNTQRLITLKGEVIALITAPSPDGEKAREKLGGALHTLQDFYSHSNWVELGNPGIDTRLGRSTYSAPAAGLDTCPTDKNVLGGAGLTTLTSGYFSLIGNIPKGKCTHGDNDAGLNKDSPNPRKSDPGYVARYTKARALAVEASADFVNQILDDPKVAGNLKAIKALMDVRGTVAFVIDDSESMTDDIDQVKAQVASMVNSIPEEEQPDQYLLVRFGDPDVGTPFVTDDPAKFLAAVNSLSAAGGGDCPELSQSALLAAIGASRSESTIFLFTDASAKDGGAAASVVAAAQAKEIKINPILTGACFGGAAAAATVGTGQQSPAALPADLNLYEDYDPAYVRAAAQTGGLLLTPEKFRVDEIFPLVEAQLAGDTVLIAAAGGTLDPNGATTIVAPVDSSVRQLIFTIVNDAFDFVTYTIRRPSGEGTFVSDPDVTLVQLDGTVLLRVDTPAAGAWKVELQGSARYQVTVQGASPLQFSSFDFAQLGGELNHVGLYPIDGQPVVGSDSDSLATLLGPYKTAQFRLVTVDGVAIKDVALAQNSPDAAAEEFAGNFSLPAQPFRVAVSGVNQQDEPYQRVFPAVFAEQPVGVAVAFADGLPDALAAGRLATFNVTVRNAGSVAADFDIVVGNDRNYYAAAVPAQVTLAPGATQTVQVQVVAACSAQPGDEVALTAVAQGASDPEIANSARLRLQVGDGACAYGYLPAIEVPWFYP